MINSSQKKLGDILVEKGLISVTQLHDALAIQKQTKEFLGDIVVRKRYIQKRDLLRALSEHFKIPHISTRYRYVHWDLVDMFSPSVILDYRCFPLKRDKYSVTFAITNPLDMWVRKKIEGETKGFDFEFALISTEDMKDLIDRYREHLKRKMT